MLLDVLNNLPRLRMSTSHFKMILWLLKKCGLQDVPSYKAFQKMQEGLRKKCGSEPKLHRSTLGNVFYVNAVRDAVARVRCRQSSLTHSNSVPGFRQSGSCQTSPLLPRGNCGSVIGSLASRALEGIPPFGAYTHVCTRDEALLH
jgi:hypothetical protein